MTNEKIIALAKEKLGKDITEQEAQDYLSGKLSLPDEALELVSGGGSCDNAGKSYILCPLCAYEAYKLEGPDRVFCCCKCGTHIKKTVESTGVKWEIL